MRVKDNPEPSHSKKAGGRRQSIWICLFLIVVTAAVYFQVHGFEFINYDDDDYVTDNPRVAGGLTGDSLIWAFTAFRAGNWHPLTWLSHMADVSLFGMNPGRHHLVNLLFHLLNSALLFTVFRQMTGATWRSAFVAALFALHPLHVESVAWVAERKDVLSAFFWMLTLLFYGRYVRQPGIFRYLPVLLCFAAGLLSKPMVVTLPFVLLLFDIWPIGRIKPEQFARDYREGLKSAAWKVAEKIPLFILSILSGVMTFYAQKKGGAVLSLDSLSPGDRAVNALVSYAGYMKNLAYPENLAVFYPYHEVSSFWTITAAGLVLVAVTLAAVFTLRTYSYLAAGWFWYLGTLVPVIGIVQVGAQSMADRYTYIPCIGLSVVIAWGAPDLLSRLPHRSPVLAAGAAAVLAVFTVLTFNQLGYWKNSITLFKHALAVTSDNYMAHNNLGAALYHKGDCTEALEHFRKAVGINGGYAKARYNLGLAMAESGNIDEAVEHFMHAVRINPDYAKAHYNLGRAKESQGKAEEAIRHYQEALRIDPEYGMALNNMGVVLMKTGRPDEAISYYIKAIRVNPEYAAAHFNLASVLARQGDWDEAVAHYLEALRIQPDNEGAQNNLCVALFQKGETEKAMACFRDAAEKFPESPIARDNYEKALMLLNRTQP